MKKRPEIDSSNRRLLRLQALVHLGLPLVIVSLVSILGIGFLTDPSPRVFVLTVLVGYLVIGYFVLELSIEYRLYRDKRRFFRDKYVDILLTVPAALLFPFAVGVGGLVLSIRALQVLEMAALVRFDLLLIEELAVAGSKIQKVGKLLRSTKLVILERLPSRH